MNKKDEEVLTIPNNVVNFFYIKKGVFYEDISFNFLCDIIHKYKLWFSRNFIETNNNFKQIIPYVIVTYEDLILLIHRTKKQTEKRLHDLLSLGIGGHINKTDAISFDTKNTIIKGMNRELNEEIIINQHQIKEPKFCGIINDLSNDVGRVHLGLLFHLELEHDNVVVNEKDNMKIKWCKISDILLNYDKMENWSKIVCNTYLKDRINKEKNNKVGVKKMNEKEYIEENYLDETDEIYIYLLTYIKENFTHDNWQDAFGVIHCAFEDLKENQEELNNFFKWKKLKKKDKVKSPGVLVRENL